MRNTAIIGGGMRGLALARSRMRAGRPVASAGIHRLLPAAGPDAPPQPSPAASPRSPAL